MDNETLLTTENIVEDAVEDIVEEIIEAVVERLDHEDNEADERKPAKKHIITGIIALVAVLAVAAGAFFISFYKEYKHLGIEGFFGASYNKYNHMGILDTTGKTAGDMFEELKAAEKCDSYEQFLAKYNLPADMPADTSSNACIAMMPAGTVAQMYNTDFATMKKWYNMPEYVNALPVSYGDKVKAIFGSYTEIPVTKDTPWGAIWNSLTLASVFGDGLDNAKEYYNLGEKVTGDTLYGEVRRKIEEKDIADRKAAEAITEPTEADLITDGSTEAEGTAE